MNKCIFLDRDGVLNRERGDYTYKKEDFELIQGVVEAVKKIKENGFIIIVITNQAGISRGRYDRQDMEACHEYLQKECGGIFDAIYYCPYHPSITTSIARKPDTLMFEKAIAKFNVDVNKSWMVGDKERDIIPANKLGIKTVLIDDKEPETIADFTSISLYKAVQDVIL